MPPKRARPRLTSQQRRDRLPSILPLPSLKENRHMGRENPRRLWSILGIGIATVAGLALLLALLAREPSAPAPMITPPIPTSSQDLTAATIRFDDEARDITSSSWQEAVLLDQVLSGLAGQPAPAPGETLQRLINEELVLYATSPGLTPTAEQVEAQIAALERRWEVDDTAVLEVLEKVGLTRAAFERAIQRSLTVQAGLEKLQNQGHDTTAWLEDQRANVEIVLDETLKEPAIPYVPIAQSPLAQSPLETATSSPIPTPAPACPSPPQEPTSIPTPTIPAVAPDFTLRRADGSPFTLAEQLAHGPVVLVFFHRHG